MEHDRHDVLADVVNIALDRGDDNFPLALAGGTGAHLLCFDVRNQVCDRLLHDPGGFHNLRQEHLAGAEQVADDIHAFHQRTLDDLDRIWKLQARLFGICDDVSIDSPHHRVGDALDHAALPPGQVFDRDPGLALVALREFDHALGCIRPAVEQHVLDPLQQVRRNV